MCKLVPYFLPLLMLFLLPGCYIGTHSFNNGKLLNPGERLITAGVGWKYSARFFKRERDTLITIPRYGSDPLFRDSSMKYYDQTRFGWCNFSIDYRIGVLRKYPFGKGLETGFHLEGAFRGNQHHYYGTKKTDPEFLCPPLLEIDTRLGFSDVTFKKAIYHHNVSLGWTIGQWIDNGWFFGYTAGLEVERVIFYGSFRYFITATDKLDEDVALKGNYFKDHMRKQGIRLSCGSSLKIPANSSVVPEYITPEFSLIFPNFNRVQPAGFSFSLGLSWLPGF